MPSRNDQAYIEQLVQGWEQVYKNSQLTLWVMLAFVDGPKHMAEVKAFLDRATNGALNVDDKSLYRALRRYYDHEITEVETAPGRGPDRKVYRLSAIGRAVVAHFVRRNVVETLLRPEILSLVKRSVS